MPILITISVSRPSFSSYWSIVTIQVANCTYWVINPITPRRSLIANQILGFPHTLQLLSLGIHSQTICSFNWRKQYKQENLKIFIIGRFCLMFSSVEDTLTVYVWTLCVETEMSIGSICLELLQEFNRDFMNAIGASLAKRLNQCHPRRPRIAQ